MKIKLLLTLLFLNLSTVVFGQNKIPSILILDPYKLNIDSTLFNDSKSYDSSYNPSEEEKIEFLNSISSKPENVKKMKLAEWNYRNERSFSSNFSFDFYGMLSYVVYGRSPNSIVIPIHETSSSDLQELLTLAKKNEISYIINPVSLTAFQENGQKFCKIRIQLYSTKANKILLDKEYVGNSKNQGFELTCEEGSFDCTFNNITGQALPEILKTIIK